MTEAVCLGAGAADAVGANVARAAASDKHAQMWVRRALLGMAVAISSRPAHHRDCVGQLLQLGLARGALQGLRLNSVGLRDG